MATNRYDQASRHLARQAGAKLWPWLLRLSANKVRFERLLPTHFTVPGFPERVGDLVAALTDLEEGGRPWAICLEFQAEPDFDMTDRLLVTLGLVRRTERPSDAPGDRYWVGAVVINLTGRGMAKRDLQWRGDGLHLLLQPCEWNFGEMDAMQVMNEVEQGLAPVEALAWISLMKGGDESATIDRWVRLARQETDPERLADLALVAVFAELLNRQDVWKKALKGWNMKESQMVKQWQDEAKAEGKAEGKAEMLLKVLKNRFKKVPKGLRAAILAETDAERLNGLVDVAFQTGTVTEFRREAKL